MSGSKKHLVVHTLVRNEARWIWFALMSVLDVADEIMVWDTGSSDSTPDIIASIDSPKISFRQIGRVDAAGHTAARQEMLSVTRSDWILILDGDEIWYQSSLSACLSAIEKKPGLSALISPFINLLGDVYHYQDPRQSRYQIGPLTGAYNIRFINRSIPGLHVANPHGGQEYRDRTGTALQDMSKDKLFLVDALYLHTTHLPRSDSRAGDLRTLKRGFKFRYELGKRFGPSFVYPEVFYLPRPAVVPDPWAKRSPGYLAASLVYTPARAVKNKLVRSDKSGY